MNHNEPKIAYFNENRADPAMPTYSGGLGVLAGDTILLPQRFACPYGGVSLLHRKGIFISVWQRTERKSKSRWPESG